MSLIKGNKKNSCAEFVSLDLFKKNLDSLLSLDKYISKKDYKKYVDETIETYNRLANIRKESLLDSWCKNNKVKIKDLSVLITYFEQKEENVAKHNKEYVKKHLVSEKDYFDKTLEKDSPDINLDEEQRTAVLSDEDYTLVVAGAGTGKTTTIEAKAKYLVEKKGVDPSRILVISFTRKATNELRERFARIGINADISTFHSVGYKIIKEDIDERKKVVDGGFMYSAIKNYLTTKLEDKFFIRKILLFFASYLNMPFDDDNSSLLYKVLSDNKNITMRSELTRMLDDYKKSQEKNRVTINDEKVRSIDECRIANFLFINGIDYEYEPIYRYTFENTLKPYCPDFLIRQNGKEVYLEHFGITESGKSNRYNAEELKEYKKHIKEKIELHKKHGTKLLYTYSKYNDKKDMIVHLEQILKDNGFELHKVDEEELYRKLAANAEDKYFTKFVQLVCVFLSKFKVNNFTPSKFDEWKIHLNDERSKLFVDIAYNCYLAYDAALKDANAIDFEDMINDAINILDRKIANGEKVDYDYIFVDEYQDISVQRYDLCYKLGKASNAKIVAVGDDWQSIYRFSGSKIDLFTNFKNSMGYADVLKITKTYRYSKDLGDIASGFVLKNGDQIEKEIKSPNNLEDPVILMSYDDSLKIDPGDQGPYYRLGKAIEKSLEHIVDKCGLEKSVALIGRYGFEGDQLFKLKDMFEPGMYKGKIKSLKYPKLNITFLTAHAAKGLGFDNVIIINGKDDILGFPSKIEDDPVMQLVIKDDEEMEFAEERRLFYVAMTRTKNRTYLITPQNYPSKFILEIKEDYTSVILKGPELTVKTSRDYKFQCPYCGYPLQKRANRGFSFVKTLFICSNDPEVCGFFTNDVKGGKLCICKCRECVDGYLIVKPLRDKEGNDTGKRILGCTNFQKDGTGCNNVMNADNFTTDVNEIIERNKVLISNYEVVEDKSAKDFIGSVLQTIEEVNKRHRIVSLSINLLGNILCGKETKQITAFRLNELKYYGYFNEAKINRVFVIIRMLVSLGILKNEDRVVSIKRTEITDDDYLTLILQIY